MSFGAQVFASAVIGFLGGGLLNAFYATVKHAWPANYFSIDSSGDYSIARNPIQFAVFRFAPPMLAVAAAGVIADQHGAIGWLTCAVVLVVHGSRLVRALASDVEERARSMFAWHACVLVAVVGSSTLAAKFRGLLGPFVPSPHEITTSIWTAIIAAVLAVYLRGLAFGKMSTRDATLRALRRMRPSVYRAIVATAGAHGYPPSVPIALAIAEMMQRPSWFRFLEYRLPGSSTRTTGIFQQRGAKNDLHSLELAQTRIFDQVARRTDPSEDPDKFLARCAKRQNRNADFQQLLTDVHHIIISDDPTIQRQLRDLENAPRALPKAR